MLTPILDRVIVRQDAKADTVRGGIIVAQNVEKPRGTVISIGPKVRDVKPGDKVLFNINWRQDFKDDGVDYIVINEPDVIAIISGDTAVEQDKLAR